MVVGTMMGTAIRTRARLFPASEAGSWDNLQGSILAREFVEESDMLLIPFRVILSDRSQGVIESVAKFRRRRSMGPVGEKARPPSGDR